MLPGSTRATVAFFTNFGKAYTARIDELQSTSGYGEPVQKLFDFSDRERIVGVVSMDERFLPRPVAGPDQEPELFGANGKEPEDGPLAVAITAEGQCVRFPLSSFSEPSTKSGRLFMRPGPRDRVIGVQATTGDENVCLASREGYVLIFPVRQISVYKNAAKGVIAMRLGKDDRVLGFTLSSSAREGLEIETNRGRREVVRTTKFDVSNRGNRGRQIIKRGHITRIVAVPEEIRMNGQS